MPRFSERSSGRCPAVALPYAIRAKAPLSSGSSSDISGPTSQSHGAAG